MQRHLWRWLLEPLDGLDRLDLGHDLLGDVEELAVAAVVVVIITVRLRIVLGCNCQ